ncbi:chemotaxis protein CheW [Gloeocapsopsis dulcis]|uniref:Chemotaxis protein CheW n=1 Tax=Gloeocapsopsis dulcis AAB1 = 1H9 TaxID=1433147 RepID=A0A6N8FYR3_9CHRO|nr:chemotaxis protein CheW [Gloeocapsopsis dulcis]MUL37056.1 chemotaxis protein CheW [Gloeocapsopsis dulcis AAB1 = 1H9]WNN87910.1 chemotaxis protein CheW [Gloeocapsopsis dulcis]
MDIPSLTPQLHQPKASLGESYLRFQLNENTPAVLLMKYVQEVLIISTGRITPIPNMPECILGLFNRRNRILWAIDLAFMLTSQPVDAGSQQYHVMIIRVGDTPLSLIVQEIKGTIRLTSDLQPLEGDIATIRPYLQGYIWQHQEKLLVLNAEAIVHSPSLSTY